MDVKKLQDYESAGIKLRIKALFFDWLFISAYLIILLVITMSYYHFVLKKMPEYSNLQSQLIATFASIIPIIIMFSIMEGSRNFASWGKRMAKLKVEYKGNPMVGSIIRSVLKFLPWQFGHMSTINGLYEGFDQPFSIIFFTLSLILPIIYILMVVIKKDHKHFADIIAKSYVVKAK